MILLIACGSPEPAPPPPTPVVLVSIDTLRADHLDSYGYTERPTSPALSAFARDAILYEHAVSSAPWTTPAHVSLFTGLYPGHHGVTQPYFDLLEALERGEGVRALDEDMVTLAEHLRGAGYTTAAFTGGGAMDPAVGLGQGFQTYTSDHYKLTEAHDAELASWLGAHAEEPFFLFWHSFEVHAPYTDTRFAPELEATLAPLDAAMRAGTPDSAAQSRAHDDYGKALKSAGAVKPEVTLALYDGGIARYDEHFGRFVEALKAAGVYDRALVVVTSDHGEEFMDHGPFFYDAHGHTLYEELVHVPLIVKWPQQAHAGVRVSSTVRSMDLMPTVLETAGLAVPEGLDAEPLPTATGRPRPAISEALNGRSEAKALQDAGSKLILYVEEAGVAEHGRHWLPEQARAEQFELSTDPGEARPGAADPELERRLRAHVASSAASATTVELDEATVKQLEAMGYVEPR